MTHQSEQIEFSIKYAKFLCTFPHSRKQFVERRL